MTTKFPFNIARASEVQETRALGYHYTDATQPITEEQIAAIESDAD